jgi:hypothetical protein
MRRSRPRACDTGGRQADSRLSSGSRPRDADQLSRVVGCLDAQVQHGIIAGALAFDPQLPRRQPDQRIEPEQSRDQRRQQLYAPIATLNVGEFMAEHGAQAFVSPLACRMGQENFRPE